MQKLTERQQQVFDFISQKIEFEGYPPTLREIGEQLGIKSTNGVNDHLKALERKGYLARQGNRSRALTLTQLPNSRPPEANALPTVLPRQGTVSIPLLGRVAAGQPILAEEHAEGHVVIDSFLVGNSERVYALRVVGDSMIEAGILDGDFIFVRKQAHADRGSIVVAMIDGEATVKRYYPEPDRVRFEPANRALAPIIVPRSAFRDTQILGTVVGVYRKV